MIREYKLQLKMRAHIINTHKQSMTHAVDEIYTHTHTKYRHNRKNTAICARYYAK